MVSAKNENAKTDYWSYEDRSKLVKLVEEKDREILLVQLTLEKKNQLLKDLQKSLKELQLGHNPSEGQFSLEKMSREITQHFNAEPSWLQFNIQFEKMNPEFFQTLKRQHPNITQREMKHCAYIKMRLATKEVSEMLNVHPRSVDMARYRIRKKLNLAPDLSLYAYLLEIN